MFRDSTTIKLISTLFCIACDCAVGSICLIHYLASTDAFRSGCMSCKNAVFIHELMAMQVPGVTLPNSQGRGLAPGELAAHSVRKRENVFEKWVILCDTVQ